MFKKNQLKVLTIITFLLISFFSFQNNVFAATEYYLCKTEGVLRVFLIVGVLLTIIKIFVPLTLIVFGSFELGKAVVSSDSKAINTAVSALIKKTIAGIVIFFIPLAINFVTSLITSYSDIAASFSDCAKCMSDYETCQKLITISKTYEEGGN